ncbi:hypothetical protein LIER_18226 [Lithospermum erythrorhizon]|uniref:Reverse transcriptase/retrotransposon-derived protein RNase H-like domain-containing protein n=1 Tax=Lithospermum erythrorhizon TaxID=34254 RepID=A0AAV3QE68_LITER
MLIKSREAKDHDENLRERFKNLRKNKLRLNPDKCVFGKVPRKEAHGLTGRITAVTRFISRAGDSTLPFFRAAKKGKEFKWTPNYEESVLELKKYLQSPQLLAWPVDGNLLQLYLSS